MGIKPVEIQINAIDETKKGSQRDAGRFALMQIRSPVH